jgi:hypothetical protein
MAEEEEFTDFCNLLRLSKKDEFERNLIVGQTVLELAKLKVVDINESQQETIKDLCDSLQNSIQLDKRKTPAPTIKENSFMGIIIQDKTMFDEFKKNPNVFVLDCLNKILKTFDVDNYINVFQVLLKNRKDFDAKIDKLLRKGKHSTAFALQSQSNQTRQLEVHSVDPLAFANFGKNYDVSKQILLMFGEKFQKIAELKLVIQLLLNKHSYYKVFKHANVLIEGLIFYLNQNQNTFPDKRLCETLVVLLEYLKLAIQHKNVQRFAKHVDIDADMLKSYPSKIEAIKSNSLYAKLFSKENDNLVLDYDIQDFYKTLLSSMDLYLEDEMKAIIQGFHKSSLSKCYLDSLLRSNMINGVSEFVPFIKESIAEWIDPSLFKKNYVNLFVSNPSSLSKTIVEHFKVIDKSTRWRQKQEVYDHQTKAQVPKKSLSSCYDLSDL